MTQDQEELKEAHCQKTETGEVVCEGKTQDGGECFIAVVPDGDGGFELDEEGGDVVCQQRLAPHVDRRI